MKYKKAGIISMVAGGAMGTSADMVYGYFVECAQYRKAEDTSTPQGPLPSGTPESVREQIIQDNDGDFKK